MTRALPILTIALSFLMAPHVRADELSDVKAASMAYYSALTVLDDGTAMSGVFAKTDYVTFVGPRTKDIIAGSDALKGYFSKANKLFKSRTVEITNVHMHVSGNMAWEVGLEKGENVLADGKSTPVDWVATNVFEKQPDGRWLMVSHHVQPGAKAP